MECAAGANSFFVKCFNRAVRTAGNFLKERKKAETIQASLEDNYGRFSSFLFLLFSAVRADARVVGVGSAGEARRPAPAPAGGCSERSEVKDTVERLESSLPSSSAPRKPAAGDPIGELVVMVAFSAPSRPRRPALALSAFPDTFSRLYRVPRACWAGSRRATTDEPCWLVAGRELEDPRGASPSLACPPARPRPQARKASFLASMPSAHMPKDTSQRA